MDWVNRPESIPKAVPQLQCAKKSSQLNDASTEFAESRRNRQECLFHNILLFRGQILFLDGSNHYVVWINHLGKMDFADFRKQLVGIEIREAILGVNPAY